MNKLFEMLIENKIVCNSEIFEIICVLVSIDYPRSFICKKNGKFYSFLEIENSDNLFGWNICEVSLDDINKANIGQANLQSLFIGKISYQMLFTNGIGEIKQVDSFKGKYSIEGNLFRTNFCDMDELFDYHKLYSKALETKQNNVSVILEQQDECNAGIILKVINYLKNIFKELNNPIDLLNAKLGVAHASTVITFTLPKDEGSLFENDIAAIGSDTLNELGNLLSTYDTDLLATLEFKNKTKILNKYKKLIDTFDKVDSYKPKIVIGSPDKTRAVSYKMNSANTSKKKRAVKQAIKTIEENLEIKKNIIPVRGILTAIATQSENSFTFLRDNGIDRFKGSVDFSMIGIDTFDVNGTIYNADIEEIKIYSGDSLIKTKYRLIKLDPDTKIAQFKQTKLF